MRLEITSLAKGGDGVARATLDGTSRVVLVPLTAPGDVVEAEVSIERGAPRARVVRLLEASSDRATPPCQHAQTCGGCDLMHLTLQSQRRHREAFVREAIARALGFDLRASPSAAPMPSIQAHHAAQTEHYRTRIRLGLVAERDRITVGYRAARSRDLIEVDKCVVALPILDHARSQVAEWLAGSRGSGEVTIAAGSKHRAALSLRWNGELASSVFSGASSRIEDGSWAGVEIALDGSREPAVIGNPCCVLTALDGEPLETPPGGFMQAHEEMSAKLVKLVADNAPVGAATIELFCGSGNITVALARRTDRLEAVEGDARALEAARRNLRARGLHAKLVHADANCVEIPQTARTVVLDPPRTGAIEACKRIAASRVRRVIMVSCDPSTLARDLGWLRTGSAPGATAGRALQGAYKFEVDRPSEARWQVVSIDLFEMFPHTSHVETLIVLDRIRERQG